MSRSTAVFVLFLALICTGCGTESARWLPDPNLDRSDDSFVIYVTDPNCQSKLETHDVRIELDETSESITVTAHVPDNSGGACNASSRAVPVVVELLTPIDGRDLLDGSRNPPARPVNDFTAARGMPIPTTQGG